MADRQGIFGRIHQKDYYLPPMALLHGGVQGQEDEVNGDEEEEAKGEEVEVEGNEEDKIKGEENEEDEEKKNEEKKKKKKELVPGDIAKCTRIAVSVPSI